MASSRAKTLAVPGETAVVRGAAGALRDRVLRREGDLTLSPLGYKQTIVAVGLERVFEISPAHRAEKHDTPRHINEFVSLDIGTAWIKSGQDLMNLETRILAAVYRRVCGVNAPDLAA